MRARLRRRRDERGASAVEYGLLVAAMAAVISGVVFGLGTLVDSAFEKTCSALNSQVQPGCIAPADTGTDANANPGDNGALPPDDGTLPVGQ